MTTRTITDDERAVHALWSAVQADLLAVLDRHLHTFQPHRRSRLARSALIDLAGKIMQAEIADDPTVAAECATQTQQLHLLVATTARPH